MQAGDYLVKPSCIKDENCLINFLKRNDFKYEKNLENILENKEYWIVINVVHRIYFRIDRYYISSKPISEIEFLNRINYYPEGFVKKELCTRQGPIQNGELKHKKLYSDNGELLYEGYTLEDFPYGLGVAYYSNRNRYREGVFDRKGLVEGKEFYSNGQVKFEGVFVRHASYGPNYPNIGNYYNRNGDLIFSGKFEVKRGGVGFPMIKYPKYIFLEEDRPEIEYL